MVRRVVFFGLVLCRQSIIVLRNYGDFVGGQKHIPPTFHGKFPDTMGGRLVVALPPNYMGEKNR
jgi:hypothetical protein